MGDMKLRLLALLAGALLCAGAAHAQIGIYVTPTFTRASNSYVDTGTFSFFGQGKTSGFFSGAGFGVYDQFAHTPMLDAGVDLRADFKKGNNAHLNEFLIGARVQFHPPMTALKPYVEVLGGVGGTSAATNPRTQSKGTFGGFGGLDWQLSKHIDWRVIEVGYSSLATINTPAVTGAPNVPSSSHLINFSTGFVFRLPQKHLIP